MTEDSTSFEFPCSYPLKIMGANSAEFRRVVDSILRKHLGEASEAAFTSRSSSSNKYLSITVTFTAQSRQQLDALYQELNDHELVLMTL